MNQIAIHVNEIFRQNDEIFRYIDDVFRIYSRAGIDEDLRNIFDSPNVISRRIHVQR